MIEKIQLADCSHTWEVLPHPKAHVAVLIQPACATALLVDGGIVTVLYQGHSSFAEGFAYGFVAAKGWNEPTVTSADRGDARLVYARYLDKAQAA